MSDRGGEDEVDLRRRVRGGEHEPTFDDLIGEVDVLLLGSVVRMIESFPMTAGRWMMFFVLE